MTASNRNALFGGLLLLASCSTSPTSSLRVTSLGSEVESCTKLGAVAARPPFASSRDAIAQLRSEAAALGADTLLVKENSLTPSAGTAYRCHGQSIH